MILLDTNIFIYLANGTLKAGVLGGQDIAFASVTKIEALGYSRITVAEQSHLEALFNECTQLDLDENVVLQAIKLRQQDNLTLGDSIIAATAVEQDFELWTANIADFAEIDGLSLHNPLKDAQI